jgi:uncharacterized membrane protein YhaH (DUF805 family)
MSAARGRGFIGEVLFALSGLLVWAAHFLVVYGATAVLCARGAATSAPLIITAATIAAVAALVVLLALGERRRRGIDSSGRRLLASMAMFGSAIALLAILWEAAAGAALPSC